MTVTLDSRLLNTLMECKDCGDTCLAIDLKVDLESKKVMCRMCESEKVEPKD